ncbi:hypothetical protein BDW67DRAFT_193343 [Aspergillus spinulosporus]
MAEVVGVVSAGIRVAAFALQVSDTIRRLRDIREYSKNKASDEFMLLVSRLERLREKLLFLDTVQTSRMVDLAIENCQLRMSEKLFRLSCKKLQSARHGEGIRNQLRDVGQRLDSVILDLTWHCYCSCHSVHRSSARCWALEYTPSTTFFEKCSNTKCTASRYRWSLHFALSRYGIPFMVNAAVEFITGAGRYSLRPGLSIERVVKYTSPGFKALWRFQCGQLNLSEVQGTFRELNRGDPSLNRHIHPGGRNYVQELFYYGPYRGQRTADQFKLLRFFASELGMTLETLDQKFLVQCAKWIGEGPHIDLLESILACGFDPGSVESPVYEEWPTSPDPFFIDYHALLANASPGFAGLTPLHETVLLDHPTSVTSFLSHSSLHMEKNFLGQTPLHLAVRDVETVRLLVQSGHDMDVQDNHGITLLIYGAGMGMTDVPLIMDILATVQDSYPKSVCQYFICCALMRLTSCETWLANNWSIYFAKLVSLCSDVNITFSNPRDGTEDNNLLHFVSSHKDVKVLAQHDFELFGQPNSAGKPALFSLVRVLDATLTQSLLDYGIDINHMDHEGRTLLFPLLQQLKWLDFRTFDVMDSIQICLKGGLDIFLSDGCRCACSPGGCFLPAAFDITFTDTMTRAPAFVWALEFLTLIEELRGREDSKRLVLGFLRRVYFERAGITHVCCHRGNNVLKRELLWLRKHMTEPDIDEILDEEEELIANLEEEMVPLTHKTLECLRSEWILMLKEKHKERLEAKRKGEHHNAKGSADERYKVDYKNDTFCHIFNVDFNVVPMANSIAHPMAEYVIWLEHQYFRSKDTWDAACEREAWYTRRMSWFVELMQIMEIAPRELIQGINYKIRTIPWEEERPEEERIVSHLMTSMRESRQAGEEISESLIWL